MERTARKQVLINRIAFLEEAIKRRDLVIVELKKRLEGYATGAKEKKDAPEKAK
jgi:hypothetical protein